MAGVTRRQMIATTALGTVAGPLATAAPATAAKPVSDPLSRTRFAGLVGATFTLASATASWSARLDDVRDIVGAPAGSDTRFSLGFTSSRAGRTDGTYALSRPGFASTPLFLVAAPDRRSWVATVNRT